MKTSGKNRPTRIAVDITAAVTQGGGIGRYTRELVGALVRADNSFNYCLFSARQPAKLPVANSVPAGDHVVYRQAPFSEQWLYRLWFRLRLPLPVDWITGRFDLFHSPDFVLPPISCDVPSLLTVHDLSFIHHPDTFTPALVKYLNRVVPQSVLKATHIVADSLVTKDDLIRLWNVHEEKITVLYSGVGPAFRPVTEPGRIIAAREKYGLGQDPYLLSVSTLQPRKNYQMLIRAFRPLADVRPHKLVIAGGKGWLYQQMMAEVENQGLTGRVIFTGFVDDTDLPALYSDAALFVFPSLYEGFGLPILEAMACGVPVVTSNASCLPEVAGAAAMQLSPLAQEEWTETLTALLADPTRRAQMVAAGFLQARKFTWKRAAEQLLFIYRQLLAAPVHGASKAA